MLLPLGSFHTISLPLIPAAWRMLSWPSQYEQTVRTCELDCTKWLADAGTTITLAHAFCDANLTLGAVTYDAATVQVVISGGVAGTVSTVMIYLALASGNVEEIGVRVPIMPVRLGVPRSAVRVALGLFSSSVSLEWTNVAPVVNGTFYFTISAPYAGVINSMDVVTANGSFTANVQVAGTSVPGLSAVTVNSPTVVNVPAGSISGFAAGGVLSVVINNATGSPTGAVLSLRLTKT